MVRNLKVYQTSQGFYDLAVAAPSMKAALEAWGAGSNLFHQGMATQSQDAKVIASALAKPGMVLRRPVGSTGPFSENAKLPTASVLDAALPRPLPTKSGVTSEPKTDKVEVDIHARRKAAELYAKQQLKRDRDRQKAEAAAAKANEKRKLAIQKAEKTLERARRSYEDILQGIEDERAKLDLRENTQRARWEKLKLRLEQDLREARS